MHKDNYKDVIVITLPVGQLRANCYLLVDKQTKETAVIDPGDDAQYIENVVLDNKYQPLKILCTHGHFDHTGAVLELKLVYRIPFFLNKRDEFLLDFARRSARRFTKLDIGPKPIIDSDLREKDTIKIGQTELVVLETSGHTPGSICLYLPKEKVVFVGDLIFAHGAVGRTDLSYSNKKELERSVAKIRKLPQETTVYPGHDESFILEEFERLPDLL